MPLKWIPRSKSGASKSRPRWVAHTCIGNVWEHPPGYYIRVVFGVGWIGVCKSTTPGYDLVTRFCIKISLWIRNPSKNSFKTSKIQNPGPKSGLIHNPLHAIARSANPVNFCSESESRQKYCKNLSIHLLAFSPPLLLSRWSNFRILGHPSATLMRTS